MEQLERQTYLMKLMLVLMRDRRARQAQVRNVGYIREYGELPEELGVYTLGQMSDDELIALANQVGIKKRPAAGRSDIYMNDLGYILVANEQELALINRASSQKLIQLAEGLQLQELVLHLIELVQLVQRNESLESLEATQKDGSSQSTEASQLAEASQNVHLSQLTGQSELHQKAWMKLISHWWCRGNLEEPSNFPAELVLCYEDPLNMNTWDIYEPEHYLERIWEQIKIVVESDDSITVHI